MGERLVEKLGSGEAMAEGVGEEGGILAAHLTRLNSRA